MKYLNLGDRSAAGTIKELVEDLADAYEAHDTFQLFGHTANAVATQVRTDFNRLLRLSVSPISNEISQLVSSELINTAYAQFILHKNELLKQTITPTDALKHIKGVLDNLNKLEQNAVFLPPKIAKSFNKIRVLMGTIKHHTITESYEHFFKPLLDNPSYYNFKSQGLLKINTALETLQAGATGTAKNQAISRAMSSFNNLSNYIQANTLAFPEYEELYNLLIALR